VNSSSRVQNLLSAKDSAAGPSSANKLNEESMAKSFGLPVPVWTDAKKTGLLQFDPDALTVACIAIAAISS